MSTSYMQEIHVAKSEPLSDAKKKESETLLSKKHKEESRLVKGVFKNLESPGGEIEFPFRMFKQDPLVIYKLQDGESYEVPLCVAKHLNQNCNIKQHHQVIDKEGKKTIDLKKGIQRYQFLSTEFM